MVGIDESILSRVDTARHYFTWVNATNHNHRPNPDTVQIDAAHNGCLRERYIQEFIVRPIKTHVS